MSAQPARRNGFVVPHKGFRYMFAELMINVGRTNYTDEEELVKLQKDVQVAVWLYTQHNKEESAGATLLKDKEPEHMKKWLDDHSDHAQTLKDFDTQMECIIAEKDLSKRASLMHNMYSSLCEYISGDLAHMQYEEITIMQLLWKHFTDQELMALEQEAIKSFDPKYLISALPYMLKGHNIDGRAELLGLLKMTGSTEAVEGALKLLQNIVSEAELIELKKRINL